MLEFQLWVVGENIFLLKQADVFFFTSSYSEGMPMSILDAMDMVCLLF